MKEPQHLENDLESVDPQVAPFGMGQFVEEDGTEMNVFQLIERLWGDQDTWMEKPRQYWA
jgi:hypothetical protein